MTPIVVVLAAVMLVSMISLIGGFFLLFKTSVTRWLTVLLGFAAGALMGISFFDLLPEGARLAGNAVWTNFALGMISFFLVEYAFHWHHHAEREGVHPMTYLNLFGDAIHNFMDGVAIAATFAVDIRVGVATTIAVIAHEIPQELSDFAILVRGGLSRLQALRWNFLVSLTAFAGALVGAYLLSALQGFTSFVIPFLAGTFVYIGGVDLLPEVHKNPGGRPLVVPLVFLSGIGLMLVISTIFE